MIEFKKITEENFDTIVKMKPPADAEDFMISAAECLAQAWLYQDDGIHPFAICADGEPVGFMRVCTAPGNRNLSLWGLLFPEEHINKGYGGEALRLLIRLARESGEFDAIGLCCHPDNRRAMHVYEREGFRPNGNITAGRIDMSLQL